MGQETRPTAEENGKINGAHKAQNGHAQTNGSHELKEQTPEQVVFSKQKQPERKFAGLGNQGATCYMNSLIQALYMSPEFRLMIYKWKHDGEKNASKKDSIIYQLQKLFATLQILQQ